MSCSLMGAAAISIEGIGKKYKIGLREKSNQTFRDAIVDAVRSPFRRWRTLGEKTTHEDEFWALRDVSFDVQPGEVVGIIGRNGAGKSTLLKILSRITEPTEGIARIRGRVGSLLEVGTGFHPELSGRENVYLNGAILGMKKAEIGAKFDEIVAFAEIDKFLDTPVKRYSSGMRVRLAFAVAAHLDPEILIIDEVLAVGDAAFQRKCLGKMDAVSSAGRTVLFVSHNMSAVNSLCERVILLEDGNVLASGETRAMTDKYLGITGGDGVRYGEIVYASEIIGDGEPAEVSAVRVLDGSGRGRSTFGSHEKVFVELDVHIRSCEPNLKVGIDLRDSADTHVFQSFANDLSEPPGLQGRDAGDRRFCAEIPAHLLNAGVYRVDPLLSIHRQRWIVRDRPGPLFDVVFDTPNAECVIRQRPGVVAPILRWSVDGAASKSFEG